jgi:hypothetical protein
MSKNKNKDRLPPFVPLLNSTLDSPAWKALSHGARSLYVALRRRVPKGRNRAYLSYRQAEAEIRASQRKIGGWFKELQYYGFIVLEQPGCLGLEGKGKAPHWRLTELGISGSACVDGAKTKQHIYEPPSNDFMRWNGIPFRRTGDRRAARFQAFLQKQNPADGVGSGVLTAWEAPPLPASEAPNIESASGGVCIEKSEGASHGVGITSLPLPADNWPISPPAISASEQARDLGLETNVSREPNGADEIGGAPNASETNVSAAAFPSGPNLWDEIGDIPDFLDRRHERLTNPSSAAACIGAGV